MNLNQRELKELGWTKIPGLFGETELRGLRTAFSANKRNQKPSTSQLFTHVRLNGSSDMSNLMQQWLNPHQRKDTLGTAGLCSLLREKLLNIFQCELYCFQDVLMIKSPGQLPFSWHQDFAYWPVDQPQGMIVWIPLQATTKDNGGLALASGSHEFGVGPSVDLTNGKQQEGTKGNIPSSLKATFPELSSGDAIVFSPLTWHTSGINTSVSDRLAWSSSWIQKDCKWKVSNAPLHPICNEIIDGEQVW